MAVLLKITGRETITDLGSAIENLQIKRLELHPAARLSRDISHTIAALDSAIRRRR